MPGQTFLGHRKGDQPSLLPLCRVVSGRTLVALVLPQHGACTAGWRWHICWMHAVKIPKSPAREREEPTGSTCSPKRGRAQLSDGKCPKSHPQVHSQPISSHMKHETWAKNKDTFFRSKAARCTNYLISFSKRNSCSFSPVSLFATAGFTYVDPWLNFKELYYWSQQ